MAGVPREAWEAPTGNPSARRHIQHEEACKLHIHIVIWRDLPLCHGFRWELWSLGELHNDALRLLQSPVLQLRAVLKLHFEALKLRCSKLTFR